MDYLGRKFSEDSFYLPTVYQTCCYTYGIFAYLYQYCCLHKKITRHFCITLKWLIIYKWLEIVVFCFFKQFDKTDGLCISYHGCTNENGTLSIVDLSTGIEVPNNSKPSKKQIIRRAIEDLNVDVDNSETLYQMYRKLTKIKYK